MTSSDHDRWSEDVAAYVLGALSAEEAVELERHLEGCERCRSEIEWLAPAVRTLPEAVQRQEPAAELKLRLMEEVRSDVGESARRSRADEGAKHGLGARAAAWLRSLGSGPMGLRPVVGVGLALLVVAAVAGIAIGGGIGGGEGGSTTVEAGSAPGVTARVVSHDGAGTLHLANVHDLPSDRVLEAWVRRDGEVEPVRALFVPDAAGVATTNLGDMDGVDTVMVTTEPPGGSRSPTSAPVVTVPIPQ